jgi:hypothetical protein
MAGPSIKGAAFQAVVTDVQALLEKGRLARDTLEARLEAEDLRILEEKVVPSSWYPIETYRRLTELLLEVEGGGRPQYVVERGARAAERLFRAGLYRQLRFGDERSVLLKQGSDSWTQHDGTLMATLAGAIFNFSRWRFEVIDAARRAYRVVASDAGALPEVARLAAQGFIEYTTARLSGAPARVTSERTAAGDVVFTIERA